MHRHSPSARAPARARFLALCTLPLLAIYTASPPRCLAEESPFLLLPKASWLGPVSEAMDAASGAACHEFRQRIPQGETRLTLVFDSPNLHTFDALELDWRLLADDANITVSLESNSERPLRRYYLRKRPNPLGHWQKARLMLANDDDGAPTTTLPTPLPHGKARLTIALSLRDLKGQEQPELHFRFRQPRLVRYPIALQGSYLDVTDVTSLRHDKGVGQRYTLTVRNKTEAPQTVHFGADTARLGPFSLTLPEGPIALQPSESKEINAELTLPPALAHALPPLASGSAILFAWAESAPQLKTTWSDSYFFNPLIGANPPPEHSGARLHSEDDRLRALEKIATQPQARRLLEEMEREVAAWLQRDIRIPTLMHGYSGHYVCPEHTSPLEPHTPDGHWCIKGKHLITNDDAVERAGAYQHHAKLTKAALTLARVGWLKKQPESSQKAKEILLAYAAIYPGLPFAAPNSTGYHSRIASAVLGECWWFDPIPATTDLLQSSGLLSDAEFATIRERLLLPAIAAIRSHRNAANQQAEANHAIALGALVAGHWPLAAEALDGEAGMRFQWSEDFDPDGISVEHELPYHFAAVKPFTQMALAYHAFGLNLFDARFRQLFAAPLAYSAEPLQDAYRGFYEPITPFWPEPEFLAQASSHRATGWSWEALLNRVDPPPNEAPPILNSTLPASGVTTLRAALPDGKRCSIGINFGSSAWRGGKALLDPVITWKGLPLNQRILRIGYGYHGHEFSYTPAAGNALLVDGQGGSLLRAEQEALLSDPVPAGRWTSPLHRPHFPGVRWSRTAAIFGDAVLLIDQFNAAIPRRFDLLSYLPAPILNGLPTGSPAPTLAQEGDGYSALRSPIRLRSLPKALHYPLGEKPDAPVGEILFLSSAQAGFSAEAQAGWHPRWIPALIQRFEGKHGWAATLYNAIPGGAKATPLPAHKGGKEVPQHQAAALRIETPSGVYLLLTCNDEAEYTVGSVTLRGPLAIQTQTPLPLGMR